ncbi:MAG TPA: AI-2E family transporter [Chloroflexia bacterium]|nr:AI-2E family transporter [Chloroflexia bacterium]
MSESTIEQSAKEAATMGPPIRTPRWLWAWMFAAAVVVMLILARKILGPFIFAAIFAYIFSPIIDNLQERLRWPRGLVVGLFYLLVLGAIGIGLYFGAEALVKETQALARQGPNIVENALVQFMGSEPFVFAGQTFTPADLSERINEGLSTYFENGEAIHFIGEMVIRVLDTILVIMVSLYLLLDGKRLGAYLLKFVPAESRARTGYVAGRIHTVLGIYLRGQLFLIGIMSLVSFLVLQFVFNVPFALPLGIMTGFLEIIPLLGPAIAAGIAGLVALSAHGLGAAIGVVIAFTILRQLEDHLIMPFVVGRAVHLHPVITIFSVLAGGAMAGILGMLLAIPVAAAIKIIIDFLYPDNPQEALAHALPGMKKAEQEAEIRHEGPAPTTPTPAEVT